MNQTAYQAGKENGELCRKYSNQHSTQPTDRDWEGAYEDCYVSEFPEQKNEFVAGCLDGWAHASGSSRV